MLFVIRDASYCRTDLAACFIKFDLVPHVVSG